MDEGHKLTDIELVKVERRCVNMYNKAEKEISALIRNYFSDFEELDAERKKRVENGEMTQNEYLTWRVTRIGQGKRFVALRNDIAQRLTNAHGVALEYINSTAPKVYALNRNFSAYQIEQAGAGVAFNLVDEATVRELMVNRPDLMPEYNPYFPRSLALQTPKDLAYGKQVITAEVTSGILQGKSVYDIADSLQHRINTMNRTSAVRAARTAVTAAQNGGRMATYTEAKKKGVQLKKEWMATLDSRTRDSHAKIDGEIVGLNDKFSNGCMYPGDPKGKPGEVYNCRCTMVANIVGYKYSDTYTAPDGEKAVYRSFKEWQAGKLASGNIYLVNHANGYYNNSEVPAMAIYPEYSRLSINYDEDSGIINAQRTNPNYSPSNYVYSHNCQRCVPAWELRERGFDVQARACKPEGQIDVLQRVPYSAWNFNLFDSDDKKRLQKDKIGDGKEQIIKFMQDSGNGARAEIFVEWARTSSGERKGHVFAAKNVNGDVVFIDPQNGMHGSYVEDYFNRVKKGETTWLRIDKLDMRENVRNEVIFNPYAKE